MVSNIAVNEKLINITKYILNSVSEEGCWGTSDFSDWGPVITVLTIDHLFSCGMGINDEWVVVNGESKYACTIERCLKYLNSQIHDDGSFGADFWDTCKMASLIRKYDLHRHFEKYQSIEDYILEYVNSGNLSLQNYDWCGPGTYAACAEFLFFIGEKTLAEDIINQAIAKKTNEGSFVGKKTIMGSYVINPVWHTAQMLRIIIQDYSSYNESLVEEISTWLCNMQSADGKYEDFSQYAIYYTAYAALGFLSLKSPPHPYTDRTIENLLSSISTSGKAGDSGGTIMVALALGAYLKSDTGYVYEKIKVLRNKELLFENQKLKEQLVSLKQKVNEYDEKYKDADIVLSKKDAFLWAIFLGVIMPIIFSLIMTFFPMIFTDKNKDEAAQPPSSQYESQQQSVDGSDE